MIRPAVRKEVDGPLARAEANLRSRRIGKPVAPLPLSIFPSRPYAILVAFLFTDLMVVAGFLAHSMLPAFGPLPALLIFAPIAPFYMLSMFHCVRHFFWNGPAIEINEWGITDHLHGGRVIGWNEIKSSRMGTIHSATHLELELHDRSPVGVQSGVFMWIQSAMSGIFHRRNEVHLRLTPLRHSKSEILDTVRAFIRFSRAL